MIILTFLRLRGQRNLKWYLVENFTRKFEEGMQSLRLYCCTMSDQQEMGIVCATCL